MAIYYSRLTTVCRSKGHSAVAAAAYRAGVRLVDERTDTAHDFTKRRGVLAATMLAPTHAPWARDVGSVWSKAERAEVRRNARTGRELVVALPEELSDSQTHALAHQLGQDLVDAYGVAVLVAVHGPVAKGDQRNRHVHLLMTTRAAEPSGFGAKVRVLDDQISGPAEAQAMRTRVARRLNDALERAGSGARVDARTLKEQASDAADRGDFASVVVLTRTPLRHQGRAATALARKGERSGVVEDNARRAHGNASLRRWGTGRADQLRETARVRGVRGAKALRTTRRQELRRGLGTVGRLSKAVGADAELLNAQAHAQEETLRAQRSDVEAYLDLLARAADQHAIAARADGERARRASEDVQARLDAQRAARLEAANRWAAEAQMAWKEARTLHEAHRRTAAQAQHETARARTAEEAVEAQAPSAWRLMSRREWAELRRRQRIETERRERIERAATQRVAASAQNLDAVQAEARRARTALRQARHTQALTPAVESARHDASTYGIDAPAPVSENAAISRVRSRRRSPGRH